VFLAFLLLLSSLVLLAFLLMLASLFAGVPAVDGVLAVASYPADPGFAMLL
jgi:hypothetical protein